MVQEVQQILIPAIQKFSKTRPYEGNSYMARAQADAASSHADALVSQVDTLHQSISEVSYAMRSRNPTNESEAPETLQEAVFHQL